MSRGKEWRYYRCVPCRTVAPGDVIEADLLGRISACVLPAASSAADKSYVGAWRCRVTREASPTPRAPPGWLSQLFAWGDLTEAEYRRQKAEVERDLALLPDDDKLVPSTVIARSWSAWPRT
jgi:hypothetical protein